VKQTPPVKFDWIVLCIILYAKVAFDSPYSAGYKSTAERFDTDADANLVWEKNTAEWLTDSDE
jgi:hypothetical protein